LDGFFLEGCEGHIGHFSIRTRSFDVLRDGRFVGLIRRSAEDISGAGVREIRFVFNWFEELKRLVPTAEARSRRARRQFTEEFKQQAVRLVLDEGKSVGAVARELDLTASALGQWVTHARADRTKGKTGLTTAEREELVRLRKALRIAEEERDILKNATAFFAKQSR
jgi:transposase